jgi:hypothetical protein
MPAIEDHERDAAVPFLHEGAQIRLVAAHDEDDPPRRWAHQLAPMPRVSALRPIAYHSPAPFDDLPEVEQLVPPGAPDSVIKLNHVVHHAAIGHHVQNWHAVRAPSRIGRIAAVDCASRIALFCGGTMAEGWACYATELMDEVGFLTPPESVAVRRFRLRMAARAVADVRLHDGAWTLPEVAAFYRERVGMTPKPLGPRQSRTACSRAPP